MQGNTFVESKIANIGGESEDEIIDETNLRVCKNIYEIRKDKRYFNDYKSILDRNRFTFPSLTSLPT